MSVLALAVGSAHAGTWSDLWYRPEQQGQRALQAGDAKRAAELFTDPRRQAYAQLRAQEYAAAAKRLEPLRDAESQYNRGNALAHEGDLRTALDDYDTALKHPDLDPALRRDARHNRDLVARQLQVQNKQPQQSGSNQQPAAKNDQNGKQQSEASKPGSERGNSSSPPKQGDKDEAGSEHHDAASPAPSSKQGEQKQAREAGQSAPPEKSGEASPQSSQQTPAEREAGARRAGGQSAGAGGSRQQGDPAAEAPIAQTEQQLATEQWLRQIPDDPGGLLRRKFMIEHLMKQQQVPP